MITPQVSCIIQNKPFFFGFFSLPSKELQKKQTKKQLEVNLIITRMTRHSSFCPIQNTLL